MMPENSDSLKTLFQCEAILRNIAARCEAATKSEQPPVAFSGDVWGPNTLTVWLDKKHSHAGIPDGSFEQMIDQLHSLLVKGEGLPFC